MGLFRRGGKERPETPMEAMKRRGLEYRMRIRYGNAVPKPEDMAVREEEGKKR